MNAARVSWTNHIPGARAWLGFLFVGAGALHAGAGRAQTAQDIHHLTAQAGNQFHGDEEVDRFDGRAEFVWQDGVQGVNPSFFIHQAVADGDAGVLSIFSRFSVAGGAGDPIFVAGDNRSVARLEESVDPGPVPIGPVTFTAQLDWGGVGLMVDGSGDVDGGSVAAGLSVNGCSVGFRQTFYSSTTGTGTPSESCSSTFYVTSTGEASAGLLRVTQVIADPEAIPTRFYVTAQIEGEASYFEYFDAGEYIASGQLSIEVSGVDFTYSSPTFLTAPEPGDAAVGAAALAALATVARRARKRRWDG